MSRIKVVIPNKKIFELSLKVRIADINYGNHLGHDSLISLLQEARIQWLASMGYTELNIEGTGLIMADIAVQYKAESFYGDELKINLFSGEAGAVNFDIFYEVKNQNDLMIAKAKTGMVCYDYDLKKVVKIPIELLRILNS